MFSKFNKPLDTIFLDASSDNFHLDDNVNVILSPSLYWVKRVKLPVKYLRELKPLIPSLFEDILPDGNYSYSAYKEGEEFFIFAYQDKEIIKVLNQKGIQTSQVKNVYFAQSELASLEEALFINEEQSLCVKNEMLVLLPSDWVSESKKFDFNTLNLSKNFVRLKQYGHIVNDKSLYKLITIASVLLAVIAIEYIMTSMKVSENEKLQESLFAKHSLKPTMMQNRSMLRSYEATHDQQAKIRDYMSGLLTVQLEGSQKISLIYLKRNKLVAEFDGVARGSEVKLAKELRAKGFDFKATFKKDTLHIEVSL